MTYQFDDNTLELLADDFAPGVESQLFHPSFSSTQFDTLGNIPKQGNEMLGELSTNRFGERKEFDSLLPVQGEMQVWIDTTCVGVLLAQMFKFQMRWYFPRSQISLSGT